MTKFHPPLRWQLAAALLLLLFNHLSTSAQTSVELRAKYGEPEVLRVNNGRVEVERYIVRPHIAATMIYTNDGQPCELNITPVRATQPDEDSHTLYVPDGDLMPTDVVLGIINEIVPPEQRGKKVSEGSMNGGDEAMRLHHPGCWGMYFAFFRDINISSDTWCNGGTFSATIHWGETKCEGQSVTIKRKKMADARHRKAKVAGAKVRSQ